MCGIAGGWWREQAQASWHLPMALKAMHHRGPDDSGHDFFAFDSATLGLAQSRLSIIDLSSAGHQPMHSQDGRWVIAFNGEIYNYKELRDQLRVLGHSFSSNSDTEVLLKAWAQWGVDCLPQLVGMFAFAVLDKQTHSLTCVRDAFGIKPFFYSNGDEGFRFASEIPALLTLLPTKPPRNMQRAYDYLVHGDYDSGADTFYEGVNHLQPAHWICVNLMTGKASVPTQWWAPSVIERPGWKFDDAVAQVREQFLDNIRLHLRSDVRVGAALSGGIDSSAVVCAMRHVEPDMPINTFSYIAAGSDVNEEHWVDLVNAHVGAISHKVSVTAADLSRDMVDMIKTQGEPFGGTSIYAQYRVYQLARDAGITVTLDGQGADEMLAGYIGYPGQRLRSLLETGRYSDALSFWNNWAMWPGRSRLMAAKYLASEMTEGGLYETLRKIDGKSSVPDWIKPEAFREHGVRLTKPRHEPSTKTKGRRVVDELCLSLTNRGIVSLLRHGDRNSMRFSVESRVPFLTIPMVNLLLSMPEEYLISQKGETKHIFREAMRGIVPDDVLFRKDKIGFATPEKKLLTHNIDYILKNLRNSELEYFVNEKIIKNEFKKMEQSEKYFNLTVWRFLNYIQWSKLN